MFPLSLSGDKRFLHLLFIGKYCLSFQNHHVNRRLVLETCCEEINVKSFVKLQFCQEEVREIERTRLGKRSGFLLLNSNVSFSLSLSVVFLCQFLCKTRQCLIRIRMDWKCSPRCKNKFKREAFCCSTEISSSSSQING